MKQALSLVLPLLLVMQLVSSSFAADTIAEQIAAIPPGAHIQIRLKNDQTLRGAKGAANETSFTLVNQSSGDHQIAFADISSVKVMKQSHAKRNVLIAAGIIAGVAVVVVVTFVVLAKTKTIGI